MARREPQWLRRRRGPAHNMCMRIKRVIVGCRDIVIRDGNAFWIAEAPLYVATATSRIYFAHEPAMS